MSSILSLPASLRIVLLAFMMISLGLILFTIYSLILFKRERIFILHSVGFFLTILFIAITRTPIIYINNVVIVDYLSLMNIIPLIFCVLMFIKYKKWIHIVDGLWFIFNITLFGFVPYYGYIVSAFILYPFIRSLMFLFKVHDNQKEYPGRLSIKYGLDDLPNGVLFSNVFGQIIYINESFKNTLSELNINSYNKLKSIIDLLVNLSKDNGRYISSEDFIVYHNDHSLRFVINKNHNQILCMDVSMEEALTQKEEENKEELSLINQSLNDELDKISDIQKEKALLFVKGYVHDNYAQQLSILHMFLLNDDSLNLKELKKILNKINDPIIQKREDDDYDYLIKILKQIDVNLTIDGNIPNNNAVKQLFSKVIKEGTTNAIRHGGAKNIKIDIKDNYIEVVNDGDMPQTFKYGNGLSLIKKECEEMNAQMDISTDGLFKLKVTL